MPKRVVVIVAIAAFIAAGLILLLAKPPQTSQPGALVAPISPLASSSVQTSATQFGITENVSSTFDTRSWITYNDADYHFAFRYPSRFVLRTTGPVAYAIKRLSLSDQRSGRLLNFYVTTTSSIAAWNDY